MYKNIFFCNYYLYSTNIERPGDLKESFDVGAVNDENFVSSFLVLTILTTAHDYNAVLSWAQLHFSIFQTAWSQYIELLRRKI